MERKRAFAVKSTYRLACSVRKEIASGAKSSRTREEKGSMWKQVWKPLVHPKLKHLLWRVIHNWLITGSVIKNRGIEVDDI